MTDKSQDRLAEALTRGRTAAERLGAATDQLTETIARIERALEELRFGVATSIEILREIEEEEGVAFTTETHLAFRKEGKRWMLWIDCATHPQDADDWHSTPLVNASRELRVLAVRKLPELIDAMAEAAEARLAEVEDSRQRAESLLQTLAPGGEEGRVRFVVKGGKKS